MNVDDPRSSLLNGLMMSRKCTDIICCLIFAAFMVAWVGIGIAGFVQGDPDLLIYPYDSSGNQCGRPDTPTASFSYLYYVLPDSDLDYRICLKDCPSKQQPAVEGKSNSWVSINLDSTSFTVYNNASDILDAQVLTIPSNSFLNRFCVPLETDSSDDSAYSEVLDDIKNGAVSDWARDIAISWSVILMVFGISVVMSVLYLVFLHYCASCVVWITMIAIVMLMTLSGVYVYMTAENDYEGDTQTYLKIGSYVIFALTVIFVIVILVFCSRIKLAIAIMKSAAVFLNDVKSVVLVPILMFVATLAIVSYWVMALVFIYSSGTLEESDKADVIASIEWNDATRNSFYFEFLGILWVNAFKVSVVQFTIAFCVCYWYLSLYKDSISSPVFKGFGAAFKYHLGSLAYGSLVITIVKLIAWFFHFLKNKVLKESEESNFVVKCMCGCVGCFVWCFEKCMEFIGKQAYIHVALTGQSFCKSAKESFNLVFENAARFAASGSIGDIFSFLGKISITVTTSYIGYLVVTNWEQVSEEIESPLAPTVVFVIVSYIVASLFISLYDMACDAIIHVYLVDEKNESLNHNYAPEALKEFMKEHREPIKL